MLSRIYRTSSLPLLPLLAALAAINALLPAALKSLSQQSFLSALTSGFGQSYVVWFSLACCIVLWRKSAPTNDTYNGRAYLLMVILSAALLIPLSTINWLICAICAALWLGRCRNDPYARATAVLLLATALRDPSTKLLLTLFADQILSLDTWLTYISLGYFNDATVSMQNNLLSQSGGYDLLILTGCSAFVNLSFALLLWLALSLVHRNQLNAVDYALASIVAITIIAINTARLTLMATDQYWYQLLHEADGAMAIEITILVIAATPTLGRIFYEAHHNITVHNRPCTRHGPCHKDV
jgi:hypothetical protein